MIRPIIVDVNVFAFKAVSYMLNQSVDVSTGTKSSAFNVVDKQLNVFIELTDRNRPPRFQ